MRVKSLTISLAVAAIIFALSCTKDHASRPSIYPPLGSCVDSTIALTYNSAPIQKILFTYCTNSKLGACHQSSLDSGGYFPYDYTQWAGIQPQVNGGSNSILYGRVFGGMNPVMPSTASTGLQSLDPCDYVVFKQWLINGAPEN